MSCATCDTERQKREEAESLIERARKAIEPYRDERGSWIQNIEWCVAECLGGPDLQASKALVREMAWALEEMRAAHQRMDPHPEDGCSNCVLARAALAKVPNSLPKATQ